MNSVLVYWVIGCLLIGYAQGRTIIECQSVTVDHAKLLNTIAIWPAYFGMALAGKAPDSLTKLKCGESP